MLFEFVQWLSQRLAEEGRKVELQGPATAHDPTNGLCAVLPLCIRYQLKTSTMHWKLNGSVSWMVAIVQFWDRLLQWSLNLRLWQRVQVPALVSERWVWLRVCRSVLGTVGSDGWLV